MHYAHDQIYLLVAKIGQQMWLDELREDYKGSIIKWCAKITTQVQRVDTWIINLCVDDYNLSRIPPFWCGRNSIIHWPCKMQMHKIMTFSLPSQLQQIRANKSGSSTLIYLRTHLVRWSQLSNLYHMIYIWTS